MNEMTRSLVNALFGKTSLDECGYPELQQLTTQYPYFAPAQFLFALKQKEINGPLYQQQVQKTSLYFHNPLWLDFLLHTDGSGENLPAAEEPVTGTEPTPADPGLVSEEKISTLAPEPVLLSAEEPSEITTAKETEAALPGINVVGLAEEANEPEPVFITETETTAATEETGPVTEEKTTEEGAALNDQPELTEPAPDSPPAFSGLAVADKIPAADGIQKESGPEPEAENAVEVMAAAQVDGADAAEETGTSIQEEESIQPENEIMKEPIHIPADLAAFKSGEPVAETSITFEPYHTVDYFASQGIKLREELLDKDKFGKQLKSFTEWLKSMKKLPKTEVDKAISQGADTRVNQLAATSVTTGEEVVTEAMAEVWTRQGNREKAIAIYEKLSLQNPAKSPYFASLIEQIKNS